MPEIHAVRPVPRGPRHRRGPARAPAARRGSSAGRSAISCCDRPINDWDLATDLAPGGRRLALPPHRGGRHPLRHRPRAPPGRRLRGDHLPPRRPLHRRPAPRRRDASPGSLEEDLVRRDFTINALAWDPVDDRLEDPTGGRADLGARLVRAVGDPVDTVHRGRAAPPARRALRRPARLRLEAATYRAFLLCAPRIERISPERVREELDRLLQAPRPSSALAVLHETGLLRRVLPELAACYGVTQNAHHAYDVFHHTLAAVDAAPPEQRLVRLAALFHDAGQAAHAGREARGDHLLCAPVGGPAAGRPGVPPPALSQRGARAGRPPRPAPHVPLPPGVDRCRGAPLPARRRRGAPRRPLRPARRRFGGQRHAPPRRPGAGRAAPPHRPRGGTAQRPHRARPRRSTGTT